MLARRPFVGGNWKMNMDTANAASLIQQLRLDLDSIKHIDMAIFPSFPYLSAAANLLKNSAITLGAQNQAEQKQGAFTGEVSAAMLKDCGCDYVLLGHSERRHVYHETDEQIAAKFLLALEYKICPVLCVGETLFEREAERTAELVLTQLDAVITKAGIQSLAQAVIAYEPVWAIGTGKTASPEQAQEVHQLIREYLATQDRDLATKIRIIYGGSVKPDNARDIFAQPDVDGGLIGGASLKAEDFVAICKAAANA